MVTCHRVLALKLDKSWYWQGSEKWDYFATAKRLCITPILCRAARSCLAPSGFYDTPVLDSPGNDDAKQILPIAWLEFVLVNLNQLPTVPGLAWTEPLLTARLTHQLFKSIIPTKIILFLEISQWFSSLPLPRYPRLWRKWSTFT